MLIFRSTKKKNCTKVTLGFWGVTAWYQSLGMRLPKACWAWSRSRSYGIELGYAITCSSVFGTSITACHVHNVH